MVVILTTSTCAKVTNGLRLLTFLKRGLRKWDKKNRPCLFWKYAWTKVLHIFYVVLAHLNRPTVPLLLSTHDRTQGPGAIWLTHLLLISKNFPAWTTLLPRTRCLSTHRTDCNSFQNFTHFKFGFAFEKWILAHQGSIFGHYGIF